MASKRELERAIKAIVRMRMGDSKRPGLSDKELRNSLKEAEARIEDMYYPTDIAAC